MEDQELNKYHKELFEHFGYNFGFVADLLEKYFENHDSVSDYWKNYFDKLTGNTNGNGNGSVLLKEKPTTAISRPAPARPVVSDSFEISDSDEPQMITGVGAKIIENMNNSLGIPTATSLRSISVKLLEENRRIINQHLKRMSGGKVSFTHLVAYALVKALKSGYPINLILLTIR